MKVAQLCPTLCDSMDCPVHGTLQARILEWVAFPLFRRSSQPRDQTQVSWLQADAFPSEPPGKLTVSSYSPPSLLPWPCCSALCGKSWPERTTRLPSLVSGNHGGWKTPDWHGSGSQWLGYFLQSSLLWHSIEDGSCVLPRLYPWLRAFSHFQPHWALLTISSTSP